ncbi:MAG TPA: hypothetical protein VKR42_01575 [Ktedonobacteraceae bacterium]|nr:hypothetical protein [Ktedonobacteraceae bacterium]
MTVYVAFALIAAIPATLALVLFIVVWVLYILRPQSKNQLSSGPSKPARAIPLAGESGVQNSRLDNAIPSTVHASSSFMLDDATLPGIGKARRRDQRAAQRAAEQLKQDKPDPTISFAEQSLKKRNPRWNALLREVAALPVNPGQKTYIEMTIPKSMRALEQEDLQDARTTLQNASIIIVLGIWYFNVIQEPNHAHARARNWYVMGQAYSRVAALSRKVDTIYHQAALKCYKQALNIYSNFNDGTIGPELAKLNNLIGELDHQTQAQRV